MKSWAVCTFIVSAVALVACGSSSDGAGGSGGNGGSATTSTGTGTTTVTSTGTGTTTTTTTGTGTGGGAGSCDNTGTCQDADQDATNDCISCALVGACSDQYNACTGDQDCVALNTCFNGCGDNDQTCLTSCAQQHPTGFQLYNAMLICAICEQCPNDCAVEGANCP